MKFAALFFTVLTMLCSQHAAADSWQSWDNVLQTHVSEAGVVDYNGIDDTQLTDDIVARVSSEEIEKLNQNQLLSFYINSYNVLAIKGILRDQSPSSLLGRYTFFKRQKYTIAGEKLNLYDFEHEKIRPLNEPRIHFAIVCASHSCPKLLNTTYKEENLDQQLNAVTSDFINNPDKNHFDHEKKVAYLSKIFKWYTDDFTTEGKSLLEYIAHYVSDPKLAQDLRESKYKIKYKPYSWKLNGHFN